MGTSKNPESAQRQGAKVEHATQPTIFDTGSPGLE